MVEEPDAANESVMQVDTAEAPATAPETVAEVSVTESQPTGETIVTETVRTEAPKPSKKTKTPGERFQRVKSDQATYLDDRLRDMSYAAKVRDVLMQSGAGDYGARANADLIVTQGKAFTKEKNKKKRGSYRGGIIDQGSQYVYALTPVPSNSRTMTNNCRHMARSVRSPCAIASSHMPISSRVALCE